MAQCEVCGNDYDGTFQVAISGKSHTFDCLECAIHVLAPSCSTCGVRVIGHGLQKGQNIFCSNECARRHGVTDLRDRA